jgi:hypothetical protein
MELFGLDGGAQGKAKKVAATLLPLINLEGGHSSLDTMGVPMGPKGQSELGLDLLPAKDRRRLATRFPTRFRRLNGGQFDLVVGNPPYVRAHRRIAGTLGEQYGEVAEGQFDLYLLFVYRALRVWVKPGGRMGFIVPNAVLDAGYAGSLRAILREYRLVEIVDLEQLRKKTFHGVKRPTVVLIVENSPGADDDLVVLTTATTACYRVADDQVDMSLAVRVIVPRRRLYQDSYLPGVEATPWARLVDYDAGAKAPWSTKLSPADFPTLDAISNSPRLGDIVRRAFRKRRGAGRGQVALAVPDGELSLDWEAVLLISTGLKLGGKKALDPDGPPVYKGQNVFPGGLIGAPMGGWRIGSESTAYLYTYRDFLDEERLYAFREIAQLPVACRAPKGAVFQNTVLLVQLEEAFPLDAWCMSRVIQFYMAKVMRSTVVEDLTGHWYKRQIALLPIPAVRSRGLLDRLVAAGAGVIEADRDLANRYRHLDELVCSSSTSDLRAAFLRADPRCAGLAFSIPPDTEVPLAGVRESGTSIVADDLFFRLDIPDDGLRHYILFALERMLREADDASIDQAGVLAIKLPGDLAPVLAEIQALLQQDSRANFDRALTELDAIVAQALQLSDEHLMYIQEQMRVDPFLKQLSILWEHRGARVQAYSDSTGEDRYD